MMGITKTLITSEELAKRVDELAAEIMNDYNGKTVTLVCVLKGGVIFMVDLARKLNLDVELDFLEISSYRDAVESGIIKFIKDLSNPITGKHVLLVEDIIDSGKTLSYLSGHLKAQRPASFKICALLNKQSRRVVPGCDPDYVGFDIPDEFVIGYGLDYAQKYRNLSYIAVLGKV
jgi:hypoxanthine phosphoribosyltransferase